MTLLGHRNMHEWSISTTILFMKTLSYCIQMLNTLLILAAVEHEIRPRYCSNVFVFTLTILNNEADSDVCSFHIINISLMKAARIKVNYSPHSTHCMLISIYLVHALLRNLPSCSKNNS